MTGADHYRAAEGYLRESETTADKYGGEQAVLLGRAQAHATLALAAAQAERLVYGAQQVPADITSTWQAAIR